MIDIDGFAEVIIWCGGFDKVCNNTIKIKIAAKNLEFVSVSNSLGWLIKDEGFYEENGEYYCKSCFDKKQRG